MIQITYFSVHWISCMTQPTSLSFIVLTMVKTIFSLPFNRAIRVQSNGIQGSFINDKFKLPFQLGVKNIINLDNIKTQYIFQIIWKRNVKKHNNQLDSISKGINATQTNIRIHLTTHTFFYILIQLHLTKSYQI